MYKRKRKRSVPTPTGPRRDVIGYVRVSTLEQATEGVSCEVQEARITAYCTASGRSLDRIIVDGGASAKTLNRDGLSGLLSDIRKGNVSTVVVLKLDRLTRSVRDLAELLDLFQRFDTALVSVSEHVDTATASGRLLLNLLTSVAQWEREAIGERTALALAQKRSNGIVYGRIPFGYRRESNSLIADEAQQAALRKMLHLYEAGASLREIAHALNSDGVRTGQGGQRWYASSVRAVLNSRQTASIMEDKN